jgi:GrpB-like predicted nucleotidyltransferase (UPF0157 family)
MPKQRNVVVVPHDPSWADAARVEGAAIAQALGDDLVVVVHHIGSTSIPGIHAKPILDLMPLVRSLETVDARNTAMEALGYEVMGEFGIAGRRFFRKDDGAGERTHNVHVFLEGGAGVARHLAFRDFMIAHPEHARAYSDLKREVAARHPHDIDAYMDGKDAFIKDMEARALEWARKGG